MVKFREVTPTTPKVIAVNTLNFKLNFKCLRLEFLGGPRIGFVVWASKPWSVSSACKNLRAPFWRYSRSKSKVVKNRAKLWTFFAIPDFVGGPLLKFWSTLSPRHHLAVTETIPPHDTVAILGWTKSLGRLTTAARSWAHSAAEFPTTSLVSYCSMRGLIILGSWYQRLDIHRQTRVSHDGTTKKEIDHVLIDSPPRQGSLQVLQSVPWCRSDS